MFVGESDRVDAGVAPNRRVNLNFSEILLGRDIDPIFTLQRSVVAFPFNFWLWFGLKRHFQMNRSASFHAQIGQSPKIDFWCNWKTTKPPNINIIQSYECVLVHRSYKTESRPMNLKN